MRRLSERYDMGIVERADALSQIREGRSIGLVRQSHRVTIHAVLLKGQWIAVVYDTKRKELATVLPVSTPQRDGGHTFSHEDVRDRLRAMLSP